MEVISKAVKKSTKQSTAKTKTNHTDNFNTKNQFNEDNQQEQSNKTKLLLDLIEHEELFHDEQKNPFITFKNGDHYETWPLSSIVFKCSGSGSVQTTVSSLKN
jgi:phage-related protein